jgi:hypothetical protein
MKSNTRLVLAIVLSLLSTAILSAQTNTNDQSALVQVIPHFEEGTLGVLYHEYMVGTGGTDFNFVTQGGQDILIPYQRFSVDLVLAGHSYITFLYQPLTVSTRSVVDRNGSGTGDLVIDGTHFAPQTPIDISYGFDFWRLSYLYDFSNDPNTILGLGASLQIRNASIAFTAVDGSARTVSQNIGPVPILKVRAAHWFSPLFGLDLVADGFYASSAFFNGATKPFTGWVWDASLSASTHIAPNAEAFLTVRSIGGGAKGNSAYSYTSATTTSSGAPTLNILATLAVSLGASITW